MNEGRLKKPFQVTRHHIFKYVKQVLNCLVRFIYYIWLELFRTLYHKVIVIMMVFEDVRKLSTYAVPISSGFG